MSTRTELEAYRSTVEELEASVYGSNNKPPRALRWSVKIVAECLGFFLFHPFVRLFDSPEGIIAESKRLIENHKGIH